MSVIGAGVTAGILLREKLDLEYQMTLKQQSMKFYTKMAGNQKSDVGRCANAVKSWNSAYKSDTSGTKKVTDARNQYLTTADYKFASTVGYDDGSGTIHKLKSTTKALDISGTLAEIDIDSNLKLNEYNNLASKLEVEIQALDSQYQLVKTQYDSMSKLEQNDAKNDTVLWCVGG